MSKTPSSLSTVTTTSSSSSQAEASTHRSCPTCKKRMSQARNDPHTICLKCRDVKCDLKNRCAECKDWDVAKVEDYLKHRRSLEQKAHKPKIEQSASVTVTSADLDSSQVKILEDRINAGFESFSFIIR